MTFLHHLLRTKSKYLSHPEEGENASYDKQTVERINDIQKMDADTKNILFNVIDTYIQNFKTKQAFVR
jgi:hypothetical protein